MESVEASGKSIEDAILQALARLGRNRNEVEISVLQEPSRGTRGMGAREARVRVFVKPGAPARPLPGAPAPEGAEGAGENAVEEVDALLDETDEYVVEDGDDMWVPWMAQACAGCLSETTTRRWSPSPVLSVEMSPVSASAM